MTDDARWWRLIASAFPSPQALREALAALSREELLELGVFVFEATHAVREPWRGPRGMSEDDTEDLTAFVVAQGEACWREAVGAKDEALLACAALMKAVASPEHPRRWSALDGTVSIGFEVFEEFERRFGDDTYLDALDAALDSESS